MLLSIIINNSISTKTKTIKLVPKYGQAFSPNNPFAGHARHRETCSVTLQRCRKPNSQGRKCCSTWSFSANEMQGKTKREKILPTKRNLRIYSNELQMRISYLHPCPKNPDII
jgi:hypothetical protein